MKSLSLSRSRIRRNWLSPLLLLLAAAGITACANPTIDSAEAELSGTEPPLIDTRAWLVPVARPPAAWRAIVQQRDDVIRHRFVRFRRPEAIPPSRAKVQITPFADTSFVLRMRRSTRTGVGRAWFGMFEDDPRGFGGIVLRPNGRVEVDIRTPQGQRYQVANVAPGAYAILEVEPEPDLECNVDGRAAGGGA